MKDLSSLLLNPDTTVVNEASELEAAALQLARFATGRDDAEELLKMLGLMPAKGYAAHVHSRYQYRRTPSCKECLAEHNAYNREHHTPKREKGFCKKGHAMIGENVMTRKSGGTRCRTCHRDYTRDYSRQWRRDQRKDTCSNGHAWTKETTFIKSNGHRQCKECADERYRKRKETL